MYSQYMNGEFQPVTREHHTPQKATNRPNNPHSKPHGDLLSEVTGGLSQMLGGVARQFSLNDIDTGDILLILIILFLFLEGDNLEVVITLGLMLLLGLSADQ